jgi:hypothetical protein
VLGTAQAACPAARDYHRTHGIRYFHGCYSVGNDQLWGVTRLRKGADHALAALKSVRAARPGGYRLFVILDNLSANKTPAIRRWARRENVELCFTPVNASWANPIEAQFGPVRTFAMGGSDHPSHTVLARKLQGYLRWRNAHARHPDVLAAQRRERARVHQENSLWLAEAQRGSQCRVRFQHDVDAPRELVASEVERDVSRDIGERFLIGRAHRWIILGLLCMSEHAGDVGPQQPARACVRRSRGGWPGCAPASSWTAGDLGLAGARVRPITRSG